MITYTNLLIRTACLIGLISIVFADSGQQTNDWQASYERVFKGNKKIEPEDTMEILIKIDRAIGNKPAKINQVKLAQVRYMLSAGQPLGNKCNLEYLIELENVKQSMAASSPSHDYMVFYQKEQHQLCQQVVEDHFTRAKDVLTDNILSNIQQLSKEIFTESSEPGVELDDILTRERLVNELVVYMSKRFNGVEDPVIGSDRKLYEDQFDEVLYKPCDTYWNFVGSYMPLGRVLSLSNNTFKSSVANEVKMASICQAISEAHSSILNDTYKILRENYSKTDNFKILMERLFKRKV